jgi:hypothetical protein
VSNVTPNTDSIIHWRTSDGSDKERVKITCGLCKGQWEITRASLRTQHAKKKDRCGRPYQWTGFCPEHYKNPAELVALLGAQQNSAHKEAGGKRGRKAGTIIFDRPQFLADVKRIIRRLWVQSKSARSITRDAVASELQLEGQDIGGSGLKSRLLACNVMSEWGDFVDSVVSERE